MSFAFNAASRRHGVGRIRVSSKIDRTFNGITFDSKAEMHRYFELFTLEKKGEIGDLELQPKYVLQPAFTDKSGAKQREIAYIADFRYRDEHGRTIVEDVKGLKTSDYKIKKKMLLYRYPEINFIEVEVKR